MESEDQNEEYERWEAELQARLKAAQDDPRSVQELVSIVLSEQDEASQHVALVILQDRGTREVFDAARSLCRSHCNHEKQWGANILGLCRFSDCTLLDESVAILVPMLESQPDLEVLRSVCFALGHLGRPQASEAICRLAHHENDEVRYSVAFALGNICCEESAETLITLSTDRDVRVRDWAIEGLGSALTSDTPPIRAALFRATADPDENVRGGALIGLARRRDERVVELIIHELAMWDTLKSQFYVAEAAMEAADPRILPSLLQIQARSATKNPDIEQAIDKCTPHP